MVDRRKGERESKPRFRDSRFFQSLDQWYFLTREGTVEGPFPQRAHAEQGLDSYLQTQGSDLPRTGGGSTRPAYRGSP